MAERKQSGYQEQPQHIYVDGTAVRREEHRTGYPGDHKEQISRRVKRNREKARHMTMPYVLVLLVATLATVVICYQYLQLQSSITNHKHQIQTYQSKLSEIKIQNNADEESLKIYTDLDYIYEAATKELGMVYPSEDQIIQYDKTESEYVRQYEDIPTED